MFPRALAAIYFFFAAVVVLWIGLNTPPFSAPDEFAHVFRADSLSSGQVFAGHGLDRRIGGEVDSAVLDLSVILSRTAGRAVPMPTDASSAARQLAWSGMSVFKAYPNTGQYGPMLYLPQAIGLAVGRGVGLSVLHSYDLARLFAGIATLGIAALAIASAGRNAFVVLVLLSTPMFLFLATSVSQDGLLISVSAVFAILAARPPSPKSPFRNWCLWSCALLMVMARPPYALLALLLIRGRNGRSSAHWLRAPDGPLAPVLICLIALLWLIADGALGQPSITRDQAIDPSAQLAGLLSHPSNILRVITGTFDRDEGLIITREIVGVLAALTVILPPWAYSTGWVSIGLAASTCLLRGPERGARRIVAAVAIILTTGALYAALYLTWTPVGAPYVAGVQGRYILPCLLAVPLVIPSLIPNRWNADRRVALALDWGATLAGLAAWGLMIAVTIDALYVLDTVYGAG